MSTSPPSWGSPSPAGPPPAAATPAGAWAGPPPVPPGGGHQVRATSGLAIASLVTGLFAWCFVVPGIVAIVLGHLALEQIDRSGGATAGRGMAIAGIVLGWIGVALLGVLVLAWFVAVVTI